MIPRGLATAIIILVSVIEGVNFFAQFIVADYHPDAAIHGVFAAIVGGALALTRKEEQDKKNHPAPPPINDEVK